MTTNQRTATSALLVLSLAAAGAPVASAMPARSEGPIAAKPAPAALYSRQDRSMIPTTAPSTTAAPIVVRVTSPSTGFDWGDAGIGAAGGIALSMVGLGGALAVSQNRARRARRTTALPG